MARSSIIYYRKHMPCPPHYITYIGGRARLRGKQAYLPALEWKSRTTRGCKLQNIGSLRATEAKGTNITENGMERARAGELGVKVLFLVQNVSKPLVNLNLLEWYALEA